MPSPNVSPDDRLAAAPPRPLSDLPEGAGVRLLEELLGRAGEVRVRVTGGSMAPFLRGGDIVTLARVPAASLRRGDVILFTRASGRPKLHRIVGIAGGGGSPRLFMTGGDAFAGHDAAVREEEIVGKVCAVERSASRRGPVRLDSRGERLRSSLGAAAREAGNAARAALSRAAGLLRRRGGRSPSCEASAVRGHAAGGDARAGRP